MTTKLDYSLSERIAEKNRAFVNALIVPPEQKVAATEAFVQAAQNIFQALPAGQDTTYALLQNARDISTQAESLLITALGDVEIRKALKPLVQQLAIRR